ncbi:hypothetical protein STENM223S_05275 [Streptomyces tendae]
MTDPQLPGASPAGSSACRPGTPDRDQPRTAVPLTRSTSWSAPRLDAAVTRTRRPPSAVRATTCVVTRGPGSGNASAGPRRTGTRQPGQRSSTEPGSASAGRKSSLHSSAGTPLIQWPARRSASHRYRRSARTGFSGSRGSSAAPASIAVATTAAVTGSSRGRTGSTPGSSAVSSAATATGAATSPRPRAFVSSGTSGNTSRAAGTVPRAAASTRPPAVSPDREVSTAAAQSSPSVGQTNTWLPPGSSTADTTDRTIHSSTAPATCARAPTTAWRPARARSRRPGRATGTR